MRRTTVAALGVALALGAGLAPATAAGASQTPQTSPDASSDLVAAFTNSPRALPGDGARHGQADKAAKAAEAAEAAEAAAPFAALLPTDPSAYYRMGGASRYATAVEVSTFLVCGRTDPAADCQDGKMGGADAPVDQVFVASGLGYADALGGGPLATGLGPLLLVPPTGTVPAVVRNEINRIDPLEIVILGGTGAVSAQVEGQLAHFGHRPSDVRRRRPQPVRHGGTGDVGQPRELDGPGRRR